MAILLAIPITQVHALGLGPITLNSRLGDPLQAQLAVYGAGGEEPAANCVTARVTSLEGNLLSKPGLQVLGKGAAATIQIAGREQLSEPAVRIVVEIHCGSAIRREYQVLLDPDQAAQPTSAAQQPVRGLDAGPSPAPHGRASRPGHAAVPVASLSTASRAAGTPRSPGVPKTGQRPAPRSRPALPRADDMPERARPSLVLQYAGTLSEPRVAAGSARPAPPDAGQTWAAGMPAGDDAAAAARAQLQEAQRELRIASQSTASLRQQLEKEKAAAAAERQSMVSGYWLALLAALLTASAVAALWLWRCRAEDKRRYQSALLMPASASSTQALPPESAAAAEEPVSAPVPACDPMPGAPAVATAAPQPAGLMLDWDFEPAVAADAATAHPAFPVIDSASPSLPAGKRDQGSPEGGLALVDVPPIDLPRLDLAIPSPSEGPAQTHAGEVAGMLLEAENWMAEHNPLRAAERLRPYLARADMLSPAPGLYLMALCQTVGDLAQVTALQAQMSARFPGMTAAWQTEGRPRLTLADFPGVLATMSTLSRTSALRPYLEGLLLPPHQFDFPVYREIVRAIGAAAE